MMNLKYRKPEEMKDSGVEWVEKVPVGWKTVRMKHLSTIVTGTTPPRSNPKNYENGHMPWIKPDNIQDDFTISESQEKLTLIGLRQARVVPIGSAIVCCIGTIGKVAFADQDLTTNQQINSVIFDKHEQWLGRYGTYSLIASGEEHKRMSNRVVVSILNKSQQGHIKMPLPDILSQTKIADFLDVKTSRFDSIISKKEKLIEKLEEAKRSLISEVVTGKVKIIDGQMVERSPEEMKDSGIEWLGMVPREWNITRFKNSCYLNIRSIPSNESQQREIQYIDIGSIRGGSISQVHSFLLKDAPSRAQRIVRTNDVIVSTVRTYLKAIAFIDEKYDNHICSTGFAVLSPKDGGINPRLLYYMMISDDYVNQVMSRSVGVSYPAINAGEIINLPCIFPKSGEKQGKLVDFLDVKIAGFDSIIDTEQRIIQKLGEAKQSLIYEAVTGKIDLRDWEIKQEGE